MNELACTQEIYPTDFPEYDEGELDDGFDKYHDMDEETLINNYLDNRVKDLVEKHLAERSEVLIDLAIKTYILQKKNEEQERVKYSISKKNVKK